MKHTQAILYFQGYRYQILLNEAKPTIIANDVQADLHVPSLPSDLTLSLVFNNGWQLSYSDQTVSLELQESYQVPVDAQQPLTILLAPDHQREIYDCLDKQELVLTATVGADLQLKQAAFSGILKKQGDMWHFLLLSGKVMLNNQQFIGTEAVLEKGDELAFFTYTLKLFPHEIHASQGAIIASNLCQIFSSRYDVYEEYPDFHRSPRIIYREPEEKIMINAPSSPGNKPEDQLIKTILPPLLMLAVTVVMAFFRSNPLFVIGSAATTVVTIIFSITGYFKSRKDFDLSLVERKQNYENYLVTKSVELHQLIQEQKQGQLYHYPAVSQLLEMAQTYSPRIYEKTPLHFDFLYYRLGLGEVKASFDIDYSNKERGKETDEVEKEGYALYEKNLKVPELPIIANLMNGPVGYIGPRPLVLEQLHLLVNQLSVFHSYHDLQLISIFPESEKAQWNWMRWLPHATLQDMNVRGFVYNQRSRDQVLNSLNQILKNRKNSLEENRNNRESTIFTPHYVVMITDEKLILDHVVMEFFNEDPSALGCSVIFVEDVMSSLSDNIKTVVDIRDRNTGVLVLEQGELKNTHFTLDHFPAEFDKEQLPRLLAPLNHLQNLKSSIPESVTFMEMYGLERFEEFNVTQRWAEHSPHKTLAVPLGLRGKDDLVYLNLHEKAHGPHGLVAGTTGSGKSEIIQSYILSLAVNFHPYDVAFLLIDYKGGGMANLFRNLPHLLGTITNLDGAQSMRALISINAELKRRQRLFSENNVNHINQYQKLYKNGEVKEPMPHLFLISDEFAELKAEQPDFMKELVSTARIGRSLGIHLILATQKPSGVVNDQIWSNSKFKLALKVADKADSMEMLRTPDAAEIVQPGRAYLQVGNNEIYELFQSAWSGADYLPDKEDQQVEDHTIYAVNDLGQYEILSEDLSGLEHADDVKQIPTELEAIIDGIHDVAQQEQIEPLPRPWLPPLRERIAASEFHSVDFKTAWQGEKQALEPVLGIVDIPSMQAQETLKVNVTQEGHMAVFSSPGYGKSTLMQTVAMDLVRVHNPARLHLYLLDFGTNGLLPLKHLPHVADTMSIDEEEKIVKFTRRMTEELKRRKKLLSEYSVASLEMYERASGKEEPRIMILLDGYEGFKGAKFEEVLEKTITQIAREGAGIGLHLLLSAGRQNALRMNLYSNIKTQIALKQIDEAEARTVVGRTSLTIDDLPGRGLIKLDEPELFQTALPAAGEDTLQIIDAIQAEVQAMDEHWTETRPEPIPMVPEVLDFEEFKEKQTTRNAIQNNQLPLGVDFDQVEAVSIDVNKLKNLTVFSDQEESLQLLQKNLIQSSLLLCDTKLIIIDTEGGLIEYQQQCKTYVSGDSISDFSEMLLGEINRREENGDTSDWLIFIDKIDFFIKVSKIKDDEFKMIYEKGPKVGLHLIICSAYSYISSYDAIPKYIKVNGKQAIIGMRKSDQTVYDKPYQANEPMMEIDEAYYYVNSSYEKIKYPR